MVNINAVEALTLNYFIHLLEIVSASLPKHHLLPWHLSTVCENQPLPQKCYTCYCSYEEQIQYSIQPQHDSTSH